MQIVYQDNRIIVVNKPSGVLSTDEPTGMPDQIRQHLGDPNACVRSVHRLDRPVSGLIVYARSRMAASILSEDIRNHQFTKYYLAVVHGCFDKQTGTLKDSLLREKQTRTTLVVDADTPFSQEATLHYSQIATNNNYSLLKIELKTGRTHQIRAQLSSRGHAIVGDKKYGSLIENCNIALFSCHLGFHHPQSKKPVEFNLLPENNWPWSLFEDKLYC